MSTQAEAQEPTLEDVVRLSEQEDQGKRSQETTTKEVVFGIGFDQRLGRLACYLSPKSLFNEERWYFRTPWAWRQFCSKVIRFPHKGLHPDVLSANLIKEIVDLRQDWLPEKQLTVKLKTDPRLVDEEGRPEIRYRGFVTAHQPDPSTTSVLRLLQRLGDDYDLRAHGTPAFPDQYFHLQMTMGDEVDLGSDSDPQPMRFGLSLAHSEVGAVRGGLRLDATLYDVQTRNSIIIRNQDEPLFTLKKEHKDHRLYEEDVGQALERVRKSTDKLGTRASQAFQKVYEKPLDAVVLVNRRLGIDAKTGRSLLEAFETKLRRGARPTKLELVRTMGEVGRDLRADRRMGLAVCTGRLLLDEEL